MNSIITWPYILRRGHSGNPAEGACGMDAVNWLVHGQHGDQPQCACPVIAAFVIGGNDAMPDDVRQQLIPYLHRIAGSRSAVHEAARVRVLRLAALRVFAPSALDAAGLHEHAARQRGLPDDVSMDAARTAATAAWAAAATATRAAAAAEAAAAVVAAKVAGTAAAAAVAGWAAKTAADAAAWAAKAAGWDDYFHALDCALLAGPEGEPWSADVVVLADRLFADAGGVAERCGGGA